MVEKVLAKIDRDEIIKLHQELVRTPSITGEENAISQLISRKMEEFGFDKYETYEFAPNRLNSWGMIKGTGGGPSLLLMAHVDTKNVEGWIDKWKGTPKEDPFSGVLIDEEIWGRGSIDCKAGMTAILTASKALKEAGVKLKGNFIVSGHGDEEGGVPGSRMAGMKRFTERVEKGEIPKADFCIYTDTSDNLHVYITAQGAIHAIITVRGKGAHCSSPWLGISAIRKMHNVITDLHELSDKTWNDVTHAYAPGPSFTILAIEGGSFTSGSVPDMCRIRFNRRINPGEKIRDVVQGIETVLRRRGIIEGLDYDIEWTKGNYGTEVSSDEEGVKVLTKATMKILGKSEENVLTGAAYSGDQKPMFDIGIPTVFCGPCPLATCHTTEERAPVDQLILAVKIYILTAMEYCKISD